jgi:hypothetical protein
MSTLDPGLADGIRDFCRSDCSRAAEEVARQRRGRRLAKILRTHQAELAPAIFEAIADRVGELVAHAMRLQEGEVR